MGKGEEAGGLGIGQKAYAVWSICAVFRTMRLRAYASTALGPHSAKSHRT